MNRIFMTARSIEIILMPVMVICLILSVYYAMATLGVSFPFPDYMPVFPFAGNVAGMPFFKKSIAGGSLLFIIFIIQTFFFWQLRKLFKCYAQSKFFKIEISSYIRNAAVSFLGITFVNILLESLLDTPLTVNNLAGNEWMIGSVNIIQLPNIFMGVVMVVLAWVMERGRLLQEEADATV